MWHRPLGRYGRAGHRTAAAEVDQPKIVVGDFLRTNDVRRDSKDNFVLPPIFLLLSEQILQYRDPGQPRITAQRLTLGVLENATDQVDFSIAQAGFMLDATLADNRLADAADIFCVPLAEETSSVIFKVTSPSA